MLHSRHTLVFKPLIPRRPMLYLLSLSLSLPTTVSCSWLFFCTFCLLSTPWLSQVLQWNAGGLRARSTELLHFLSSHPVDLICIQESNLNSSSSFRISGFSALHSDRTHSRSGILSPDATHASGDVIIFVRQGLSFSELSTSSLSSLDPYSDGFNKPRPGSQTILSTIDFSKAFDSVWHSAFFHKLISAGLPPCIARWTPSFYSDRRACVVYQNHKSRSFRVRRGVPQGSVLGPVLFSLFINDLPASLPSSVSCSLYTDDMAIWSSSPSGPTAVGVTQGALFRLEDWSEYWCLSLNPS